MAGHIHAKPPMRERTIDGTTYIVTSHFKQTGSTVADHIRRLIDTATKNEKIKRIYWKFARFIDYWHDNSVINSRLRWLPEWRSIMKRQSFINYPYNDSEAGKWAALYVRLSRDDDNEGDSNSIAHQVEILKKYAKDHNITQ